MCKSCIPVVLLQLKWSLSLRAPCQIFMFIIKGNEIGPYLVVLKNAHPQL